MIHRFVFKSPKPGRTVEAFRQAWNAAVRNYIGRSEEVRHACFGRTIEVEGVSQPARWHAFADITFDDEAALLQALQRNAYLEDIRAGEPNWCAIWNTLTLDTRQHAVYGTREAGQQEVTLVLLTKRRWGASLEEFRRLCSDEYLSACKRLRGLCGYVQHAVVDSAYVVGEPQLDAIDQLWFDSLASLNEALAGGDSPVARAHSLGLVDANGLYALAAKEEALVVPRTSQTRADSGSSVCDQNKDPAPVVTSSSGLIRWVQRKDTGARAIAKQLRAAGLAGRPENLLIGNPGSGEELLYLELASEVQLALAEPAVGGIADGVGRLHSKPAVAIAHGFVGFSGLQGAVFNAAQRQSPMLVIVGIADSHAHTGESHMFADVAGAAKASRAKYVKQASDARTLLRDLRDAIIQSQIPPYGPVVFIVGSDVAGARNSEEVIVPAVPVLHVAPPRAEIERLADKLRSARKPAILIGDGVARSHAQSELQRVAELAGAEVWSSMESEVNMPRNHAAFQGNLGHMNDSRGRELLKDVDFALAVGTPIYQTVFNSRIPLFGEQTCIATINFDVDSTLRGHNDVHLPILGDPRRVLEALAEMLQQSDREPARSQARSRLEQMRWRKNQSLQERRTQSLQAPGVTMGKFGQALERRMKELRRRPVIFNEALVGAVGLVEHIENVNMPGMYFDTSGGSLGEWVGGVGAAMTGTPVVAVIGDGGFHYAPQALWNAARRRLQLGLVVANNAGYGLLYDNMNFDLRQRGIDPGTVPSRHFYEISHVDYVAVAQGYGVGGMRVEREDQIDGAVDRLLGGDGPFLIDLVLGPYRKES